MSPSSEERGKMNNSLNTSFQLRPYYLLPIVTIFLLAAHRVTSVTHSGHWSPSHSYMKVIARFGFIKSDLNNHHRSDGYIFGNVTTRGHSSASEHYSFNSSSSASNAIQSTKASVLLVDRNLLIKILGTDIEASRINLIKWNQLTDKLNCSSIFSSIITIATDDFIKCNASSTSDSFDSNNRVPPDYNNNEDNVTSKHYNQFIRYIPCERGSVCPGSLSVQKLANQITRSQLAYVIKDQKQPAFWYLLFIACRYDSSSCKWIESTNDTSSYEYKFKLVNGRPDLSSGNIFTYHFSYEDQDLILYIVMLALYVTLTIFQMYAIVKQRRRNLLVYLFTISLVIHCSSYFLSTIHKIVFAQNGVGYKLLFVISDVLRIASLALFIVFALIISKGWPMTRSSVAGKPLLLVAFVVYIVLELILSVWIKNSLDIVKEIDEYHTVAGWTSLLYRTTLMLWFLCELRSTMMIEQNQIRLRFYLHFGAGIMVWFVNLPIVTIIALQISPLMRYKLIMGFSSAANVLAYVCVTHIMWPTKMSYHFLTHPMDADFSQEELEDYDHEITDSNSYFNNASYSTSNGNNNHNTSHRNSNASNKTSRSRSKTRFSIDSQSRNSNHVKT